MLATIGNHTAFKNENKNQYRYLLLHLWYFIAVQQYTNLIFHAHVHIFILWFLEELDVFSRVFRTTDKTEIIDSDVMNKIQDYSFGTITRETQTGID